MESRHRQESTLGRWKHASSRALRSLEEWPPLRQLDYLTPRWALVIGVALGGVIAYFAVMRPGPVADGLTGLGIVVGVLLVISSRPVGVWGPRPLVGRPSLDMVAIRGGRFIMGSPLWERGRFRDEVQHRVQLSDFWMSRTPITREQYQRVMGEARGWGDDQHPMTEVSWFEAVAFCIRLSAEEGLPSCYVIEGERVSWVADEGGYRLPTEAEWEYAARAGSKGRWPFPASKLDYHAWYGANSGGGPQEVATRKPNPWGLHDMHGNVWEWCWDAYGPYGWGWAKDPRDPRESRIFNRPGRANEAARSVSRVLRGGAFWDEPRYLRSAYRVRVVPENRNWDIGFRCVRRPVPQLDPSSS